MSRISRVTIVVLLALAGTRAQAPSVPTPSDFLGISIGADGVLADWDQIVAYARAVASRSDRIAVEEIGRTTEDRPYLLAVVTSAANHRRLEHYRAINDRLADPRRTTPDEAEQLAGEGRTIVALQVGIHSTEVGGPQAGLEFLHRFATEETPRMQAVLDNCIILFSPSHNPDGTQMVAEWVRRTNGTPFEGAGLPWLYHKYVGHDNNRDWYFFTQQESRLSVERIWNVWKPQISFDMHQMGGHGARIFVPPYIDPYDPNIDPILRASITALGTSMALRLLADGKDGVVINAIYDMWTPARGYVNYQGGVRMLSEVASARLASPIEVPFDRLARGIGYDPTQVSWNFARPWRGGVWRLRDIMDYKHAALDGLLDHAAAYRTQWLRNFYRVRQNAIGRTLPATGEAKPYAIVVPHGQSDPVTASRLLWVLHFAALEVHRARAPFTAGGHTYPAGSHVVLMAQPSSSFANTMTSVQRYPDLRQYPDGPPQRPYDVTAHTLPLLMGVEAVRTIEPFAAELELLPAIEPPPGSVAGGRAGHAYIMDHQNGDIVALNRLLQAGVEARWATAELTAAGRRFPPGAIVVPVAGQPQVHDLVAEAAREAHTIIYAVHERVASPLRDVKLPRVGLYQSWVASMDEGWTRWLLEQFGFPYTSLHDRDLRAGGLRDSYDAIVLPAQSPSSIINGHTPGTMPPEYVGGIGREGVAALRAFVEAGGTLVTLDSASLLPIQEFGLPVTNALAGVSGSGRSERREGLDKDAFYAPGSIVRTRVDVTHPIAFGSPTEGIAWFQQSPAFEIARPARAIVTYPDGEPLLLSGWLLGGERLAGRAAVVEAPLGRGRVVLFGFRPQYRAQTWSTFKLFFNALYYATFRDPETSQ